ncbi:MAG: threonine/serine exporter family protein [Luteolibacter sp.]|uniref:threonine/serine ThrE exporter family protein n=1 Tax=Luteolibacter sp. TaxID=1962973 RepID=UPI00326385A2
MMLIEDKISDEAPSPVHRVADLLLDIGLVLLVSGAHCGRVSRNLERVAKHWGYQMELFMSFTGLSVHIWHREHPDQQIDRFRRCPLPGVHFGIVTEISLLTWRVVEENLAIDEVETRMAGIRKLSHHPRWLTLSGTGSACACLCLLTGGNWVDGGITFVAAVCGLFLRQEVVKARFNPLISFIVASFVTTLIASGDAIYQIGQSPEKALATSVLYLVPGVPLINCIIDLIEGHLPTAIARGVFGGLILLCIAVGMALAILLIGVHHFRPQ